MAAFFMRLILGMVFLILPLFLAPIEAVSAERSEEI
jgi:hypothetical protein